MSFKYPRKVNLEANIGIRKRTDRPGDIDLERWINHAINNEWINVGSSTVVVTVAMGTTTETILSSVWGGGMVGVQVFMDVGDGKVKETVVQKEYIGAPTPTSLEVTFPGGTPTEDTYIIIG